jgi:hypothetical protein
MKSRTTFKPTSSAVFQQFGAALARYPASYRCLVDAHGCEASEAGWWLLELECRDRVERSNGYDPVLDAEAWCGECREFGHEPPEGCQHQRRSRTQPTSTSPGRVAVSVSDDPIKRVDLREYLMREGVDVPARGKVRCIAPDHPDVHPSMSATADHFRCWSCGAHGDVIEAASLLHGIDAHARGYWELRDLIVQAFEGAAPSTRSQR